MPCTYVDATYNEVLTWTEGTRIKYAPNKKNGKSFHRYGKYMNAKTVGEALACGSYPLDLLFDFEKGLLKAVGGPKRKQPPLEKADCKSRTDKVLCSMLSKWKCWRATFETMEKSGVDRKVLKAQVDEQDGTKENLIIACNRRDAQLKAKEVLASIRVEQRKTTEADVLSVLRLWGFYQNSNRLNVMQKGTKWVHSDTLGLIQQTPTGTVLLTQPSKRYPEVFEVLCRWLKDNKPKDLPVDFPFTSINVNKGYGAKLHRDANNKGVSMIKAFGEFTGGELNFWPGDDKRTPLEKFRAKDAVPLNLRDGMALFDGQQGHSVNTFEGERYSLVYFTLREHKKSTAEMRKALTACSVSYPRPETTATVDALAPYQYWPTGVGSTKRGRAESTASGIAAKRRRAGA